MPIAEGKNIHFSPVDNKPLCSYSSKLCRQRRLNGYGFCIRHILEDKSAPFKQCEFVTRNNSQKCLNAIPTNQERGYCHSHMQVAGIIPKTERKLKPPTTSCSKPNPGGEKGVVDCSETTLGTKSLPNGLNKPNKSIPKGKQNASSCPFNAVVSISTGSTEFPPTNGCIKQIASDLPPKKKGKSNGKRNDAHLIEKDTLTGKPRRKKAGKVESSGKISVKLPVSSTAFEQLKTLKILEKLPLRTTGETTSCKAEERPESTLVPFFFQNSLPPSTVSSLDENENKPVSSESRQEFLCRVRSSFKSQYQVLRRVMKVQQKSEVKVHEPLRESLLSCVVLDPSRCAHILVNGEDEGEVTESKGKKGSKILNGLTNAKRKGKTSSTQGNTPNISENLNSSTVPKSKKGKFSTKKITNPATPTHSSSMNETQQHPIQLKIEEEQLGNGVLNPWLNGHVDLGSTLSSIGSKSKNKAQNSIKLEAEEKNEFKKVPASRKERNGILSNGTDSASSVSCSVVKKSRKPGSHGRPIDTLEKDDFEGTVDGRHGDTSHFMESNYVDPSFGAKKRRIDISPRTIMSTNPHHRIIDPNITLNATANVHTSYSPSHLSAVAQLENVLHSVSSSDTATTPDGVMTDASFDSPFDHSTSSHPDCDFPDDVDELEKSFELHIDAEIAHQASRLIEENGFTEEDFSELFPDNRLTDQKLGATDLGLDFSSANFEPADIDYAIFSNMFPSSHLRSGSTESVSLSQNF